ncbi:MAG: hypothetical protein AAB590_01040 [Patescibacteria group bacterium]
MKEREYAKYGRVIRPEFEKEDIKFWLESYYKRYGTEYSHPNMPDKPAKFKDMTVSQAREILRVLREWKVDEMKEHSRTATGYQEGDPGHDYAVAKGDVAQKGAGNINEVESFLLGQPESMTMKEFLGLTENDKAA